MKDDKELELNLEEEYKELGEVRDYLAGKMVSTKWVKDEDEQIKYENQYNFVLGKRSMIRSIRKYFGEDEDRE